MLGEITMIWIWGIAGLLTLIAGVVCVWRLLKFNKWFKKRYLASLQRQSMRLIHRNAYHRTQVSVTDVELSILHRHRDEVLDEIGHMEDEERKKYGLCPNAESS